uniref:WD repeat domain 53 n=1 Tax=Latimeria chalumnae TaxID=7897 RepID=H3A806_LATCH
MAEKWTSGHAGSVLCLGASSEGLVVSGAEEGELTLWNCDGRSVNRVRLDGGDVACVTFSPQCPYRLYASHGETVTILDTRSLKAPVEQFCVNEEEVNSLSVNETEGFLAAGDDSGAIRIIDLSSKKLSRSLRRHTNICSSVAFRPQRPQSLISCGLDMQVMLWNLQKARPVCVINLQELSQDEVKQQTVGDQLFNPPLVHSVAVAPCGNVFACGAEDGKVRVFHVTMGTQFEHQLQFKAHRQGVGHVQFWPAPSHPYWLLSGGNDGKVAVWDVSEGGSKRHKATGRSGYRRKGRKGHCAKEQAISVEDHHQGVTECCENTIGQDFLPKFSIDHDNKVNWLCAVEIRGTQSILVADQSSSISVYVMLQPF